MPPLQAILKNLDTFLKNFPVWSSFPFSLLLIGLEEVIELNFSCPCKYELNKYLTAFILTGPPLFAFALMFIALRPCNYGCRLINKVGDDHQSSSKGNNAGDDQQSSSKTKKAGDEQQSFAEVKKNKDDQQNFWKALGHCLIPPIMWIITALIDGDYVACGLTKWKGTFVFDKELKRLWCKPIESANAGNQSDLRQEYQGYISISTTLGYAVLAVFSVVTVFLMSIYDCFTSGKCDCFKNENSGCCRGTQRVQQDVERGSGRESTHF